MFQETAYTTARIWAAISSNAFHRRANVLRYYDDSKKRLAARYVRKTRHTSNSIDVSWFQGGFSEGCVPCTGPGIVYSARRTTEDRPDVRFEFEIIASNYGPVESFLRGRLSR